MVTCSWDTKPHPSYNYYGTGNVEEVLPGVIKPLAADLIVAETNAWAKSRAQSSRCARIRASVPTN